ncbi:MAG: hypothetical protein CMJ58_01065 [Planctomycetaceae bacterium]|nr:hypothetical protein [Planctomycetaceae bacterium]
MSPVDRSIRLAVLMAAILTSNAARAPAGMISKPPMTYIASPNFNGRNGTPVDTVVMHTTEETLADTLDIFLSPARQVSAHFVVAPNGDIYQMVDTSERAWHATYYNSRSIGIEMVGYASQASTWNDDNLGALVNLLAWIIDQHPGIPLVHPGGDAYDTRGQRYTSTGLVAHGQVQPWNRSDPGPFLPWDDVIAAVDERLAAVPEPATALLAAAGLIGALRLRATTL